MLSLVLLAGLAWTQAALAALAIIVIPSCLYFFLQLRHDRKQIFGGFRKSGEQSLRANYRELPWFFQFSQDLLAVSDFDGKILLANPAWRRALGYPAEEILGRDGWGFVHADDASTAIRLREGLKRGEPVEAAELRFNHLDGSYRWMRIAAVSDVAGGRIYWAGCDITEFKLTIEQLTESSRAVEMKNRELEQALGAAREALQIRTRFLATLSHEIRTPMHGIIGMSELLLATPLQQDQREYASMVRESARALLQIVNNILDLSRLEAGRMTLACVPFCLTDLLDSVFSLLYPDAKAKNLNLRCYTAEGLPEIVYGDPTRLRQVLVNLVGNAVKFTEKGMVVLRASRQLQPDGAALLRFEVEDSGIGIDPDRISYLFEAFTQADQSTTRRYGGSGLGLAISKQLVEAMGGQIGGSSHPGQGSLFWFTLPLRRQVDTTPEGGAIADATG